MLCQCAHPPLIGSLALTGPRSRHRQSHRDGRRRGPGAEQSKVFKSVGVEARSKVAQRAPAQATGRVTPRQRTGGHGARSAGATTTRKRSAGRVPTIGKRDKWPSHAVVVPCFSEPSIRRRCGQGHIRGRSTGSDVTSFNPAWWADQSGATAIEYGLIAGSISIVIFVVVNGSLGVTLNKKFVSINTSLK